MLCWMYPSECTIFISVPTIPLSSLFSLSISPHHHHHQQAKLFYFLSHVAHTHTLLSFPVTCDLLNPQKQTGVVHPPHPDVICSFERTRLNVGKVTHGVVCWTGGWEIQEGCIHFNPMEWWARQDDMRNLWAKFTTTPRRISTKHENRELINSLSKDEKKRFKCSIQLFVLNFFARIYFKL